MNYYLLIYTVSPDYLEKRGTYRKEHLNLAENLHKNGQLLMGGALADPADQAILLFRGETPAAAEAFVQADPYVKNGLVLSWEIRKWTVVIGNPSASGNLS
ncbi:YciI-like protein [Cyclobacterium jeungdonense]|uniref:YciI-like protein n=1 Tax=Cyclobacterium jeungdonense TaxID=708087 RepID=A0ABT8CC52_9BACT|nr:YciI-like protein [Cyclobacterium jeungdonense]MDN3689128.1 YciI-like protein [Cyclobacterium jeungdonense]